MSAPPSDGALGGFRVHRAHYQPDTAERRIDGLNRDELCRRYQAKVLLIARRVHERLSAEARIPLDDLAAVGAIGLLEAFDRYDPSRGILFGTFAEYRIRGAMYDALRENDSLGRPLRQQARRIEAAKDDLRKRTNKEPKASEVARFLGVPVEEYHASLDRTKPVVRVPLDATSREGEGRALSERLPDSSVSAENALVARDVRELVKKAIQQLPDRQRQAVLMYYGSELTLAEIAAVFGVTVSRVSQILTEARERLRKIVAGSIDPSDLVST